MSRLYTPDGQIRQDISVRETAGGGRATFKVNDWTGENGMILNRTLSSKEEANRKVIEAATKSPTQPVVAGKTTNWDNSGEVRISQRGGKDNRIKHIRGNDIFADVPQPLLQRPTSGLKSRDLYGSHHSFQSRQEDPTETPVFGTANGGRFSPGYRQRTVTETKKRDLRGSGGIWFADESAPVQSGSLNGVDPPPRPVRANAGRVTGGGPVSVKLG